MVIEIAPANGSHLFVSFVETSKRALAAVLGLGIVAGGVALLVMPGFEAQAMVLIKAVMGILLIAVGVSFARVGGARKPIELAFDRKTHEWKIAPPKGKKGKYQRVAPRGSVLTLMGSKAAMTNAESEPLFDLHLDSYACAALASEARRLRTAA